MVVKNKITSSILIIFFCAMIMVLLMHFAPVLATSETPSEIAATEIATEEATGGATEQATFAAATDASPRQTADATASSEATEEATQTGQPMPSQTPVRTPVTTPVPTKKPAATTSTKPTTPPKLEILTPPGLSGEVETPTPDASTLPESSATGEGDSSEITPTLSPSMRVEHVQQVEVDPGFRMSDFIQILCYIVYGISALILLVGILRVVILLVFKKDILPSKKERRKAKEERQRRKAIKENQFIQKDVSPEEFNIRKDDWDWK